MKDLDTVGISWDEAEVLTLTLVVACCPIDELSLDELRCINQAF